MNETQVTHFGHAMMYRGALIALGVSNTEIADKLATLTTSTAEAFDVVMKLKDGKEGDRVYPVLRWLEKRREEERRARS